jgi:hypothetical protein
MINARSRYLLELQLKILLGLTSLLLIVGAGIAQVQPTFFGMHVNKQTSMPVTVPVASIRLWDTTTNWFQLCPTKDVAQCDWHRLDEWLAAAKRNGVSEVVYTFGKTPDWISSDPNGDCWKARPGVCYPPRDVAADGGGTDSAFQRFVEAIVEHNQRLNPTTYAKIKFWGIWNEPTAKFFWAGTSAQLVRMAKDAQPIIKKADPTALMLTPEPAANSRKDEFKRGGDWLDDYLAQGGGKYADVIAFHVYANNNGDHPAPEDVVKVIKYIKAQLARHPEVARKALWITEASWGRSDETNWDHEGDDSAFLLRYYVLIASEDIERLYWYGWDVPTGTLSANGKPLPVTNALSEVHSWLVGRKVTNCSSKSHVWSCDLGAPGYQGRIVWDEEYGKTTSLNAGHFSEYRSGTGEHGHIKGDLLPIGNSPVLLEEAH